MNYHSENLSKGVKFVQKFMDDFESIFLDHGFGYKLDSLRSTLSSLINILEEHDLSQQYLKIIGPIIDELATKIEFFDIANAENERMRVMSIVGSIRALQQPLSIFENLGYLSGNIAIVGANGSGKTSYIDNMKKYSLDRFVVIPSQKILVIEDELVFRKYSETNPVIQKKIEDPWNDIRTKSNDLSLHHYVSEYSQLLSQLITNLHAEHLEIRNSYLNTLLSGDQEAELPDSKLDVLVRLWNELMPHRSLKLFDRLFLEIRDNETLEKYPLNQMSDGEKVVLFLIAMVLQAKDGSFIFIDEPEQYLHKAIVNKLWDRLEAYRSDCYFVYLSHDLDFVSHRTNASKLWIKSFAYPNKWEIEKIPETEIPEDIILELVGSRQNILFCEGLSGKNGDDRLYEILLPNFMVKPVASCRDVINYTKAYNEIGALNTKAYGIVDKDHRTPEEIRSLENRGIFTLQVAEFENVFMVEGFLKVFCSATSSDPAKIEDLTRGVVDEMKNLREIQAANYVSSKINYVFETEHVSKGNSLDIIKRNYDEFASRIEIDKWYEDRLRIIDNAIESEDYQEVISLFNNKGLFRFACKYFDIGNYKERSFTVLQNSDEAKVTLRSYLPAELVRLGT